jgi:hypothetical protein
MILHNSDEPTPTLVHHGKNFPKKTPKFSGLLLNIIDISTLDYIIRLSMSPNLTLFVLRALTKEGIGMGVSSHWPSGKSNSSHRHCKMA